MEQTQEIHKTNFVLIRRTTKILFIVFFPRRENEENCLTRREKLVNFLDANGKA